MVCSSLKGGEKGKSQSSLGGEEMFLYFCSDDTGVWATRFGSVGFSCLRSSDSGIRSVWVARHYSFSFR